MSMGTNRAREQPCGLWGGMGLWACVCYVVGMEAREQFIGIATLLPLCGSWRLNSGHLISQQTPLSGEPSQSPYTSINVRNT